MITTEDTKVLPKLMEMTEVQRIEFHTRRICTAMGSDWAIVNFNALNYWHAISNARGEMLSIGYTQKKRGLPGRIVIGPQYPNEVRTNVQHIDGRPSEISVAENRSSTAIVREIDRRLMPAYREHLAKVLAGHTRDVQYSNDKKALVERLRAAAPDIVGDESEGTLHVKSSKCEAFGSIQVSRVSDKPQCLLRLNSVPFEVAMKVLQLLSKCPPEKE